MSFYVIIERMNGRNELVSLAEKLYNCGFDDRVEYYQGGWLDSEYGNVYPHLKFENEDDAIAYALSVGKHVIKSVPTDRLT